jgi:hypothetical protein
MRPDDRVVVDGLLRVRPGTKVNPKPAEAMTPPDSHAAPVETAPAPRVRS